MNTKRHRLAIILVIILLALLFLFSSKKVSGTTATTNSDGVPINVSIPSLNLPDRSITVNVPGLPSFTPYAYNAISPCMCNGSAPQTTPNSGPLVTFVTNQGNRGPTIYDYTTASAGAVSDIMFVQR